MIFLIHFYSITQFFSLFYNPDVSGWGVKLLLEDKQSQIKTKICPLYMIHNQPPGKINIKKAKDLEKKMGKGHLRQLLVS